MVDGKKSISMTTSHTIVNGHIKQTKIQLNLVVDHGSHLQSDGDTTPTLNIQSIESFINSAMEDIHERGLLSSMK